MERKMERKNEVRKDYRGGRIKGMAGKNQRSLNVVGRGKQQQRREVETAGRRM